MLERLYFIFDDTRTAPWNVDCVVYDFANYPFDCCSRMSLFVFALHGQHTNACVMVIATKRRVVRGRTVSTTLSIRAITVVSPITMIRDVAGRDSTGRRTANSVENPVSPQNNYQV